MKGFLHNQIPAMRYSLHSCRSCSVATPRTLARALHTPSTASAKTPQALQNAASSAFHPAPGTARLRFAPSPTGYLHLGGLRTALFNHLFARKWKGKWILRIEDTDRARLVGDAIPSLQRTLDWAGLDYDEGPGRGGDVGPYVQSERLDIYHHHAKTLLDQDKAYHCFCSPDDLAAIRKTQLAKKATTSYDGRCRHLTEEEVKRKKQAGEKFVLRFKDPGGRPHVPPDMLFGPYSSPGTSSPSSTSWSRPEPPNSSLLKPRTDSDAQVFKLKGTKGPGAFLNALQELDDFILIKGDGYPTYHFASVVDDSSMGITHVFRGEEWLPSTRKHYQIYDALSLSAPHFAHLPLLVNPDGTKLSKRTGDVSVEDYIEKGYESSALINFLALIGWDHHHPSLGLTAQSEQTQFFPLPASSNSIPGSSTSSPSSASLHPSHNPELELELRKDYNSLTELYTLPMLVNSFELERVGKTRGSVFLGKLDWLNKMHLRRKGLIDDETGRGDLVKRVREILKEKRVLKDSPLVDDLEYIGKVVDIELPRATILSDIPSLCIFFFLSPELSNHEAVSMAKEWTSKGDSRSRYLEVTELMIGKVEKAESLKHEVDWFALIDECEVDSGMKRGGIMKVLRHGLTGRKNGPSVPSIMNVLGSKETAARLQKAREWISKGGAA